MLTREAIIQNKATFKLRKVSTPEWADDDETDAHVFVRTLAGDQAGAVQRLASEQHEAGSGTAEPKALAGWCILGICNDKGAALFTEEDIPALLVRPLMPLQRCATAIMELNGVTEATEATEKKA